MLLVGFVVLVGGFRPPIGELLVGGLVLLVGFEISIGGLFVYFGFWDI